MGARAGRVCWAVVAVSITPLMLASCGERDASSTSPPPSSSAATDQQPEIERSYSTDCDFGGRVERCTLRLGVNKANATVADRITLVMEAGAPTGVTVRWPEPTDLFTEADVLSVEDERSVDPAGAARVVERRVILVEPFLPGDRDVPAVSVGFAGVGGALCTINTDPFTITVTSLLADAALDEPELRDVVEPPPARGPWWIWPLAIAGGLTLAGLTAFAIRRRGARKVEPLTPYAEALRRLKELEEAPPVNPAEIAATLGDTLRRYVAGVLNMEPKDRTTEELMSEIGDAPTINVASVQAVLARLDEVSFAGASVATPEVHELRDRVYKLVTGIQAGYAADAGGNA